MKKILQLLFILFIFSPSVFGGEQSNNIEDVLAKGKWVNYSDGYVPIPTYDPADKNQEQNITTKKRYKTFGFEADKTFILDSAKVRYTGRYMFEDGKVHLTFNPVKVTNLSKNTDPNNPGGYVATDEIVRLPDRTLHLNEKGNLTGDGSVYKNYSGAISGLFNFYEFSGFANISWRHLVMMLVGFIFIFLGIRYEFEPLLLIPIGFGILIGNIPMFQVTDFNLKLGIYEPGSVMNILYQGVVQGW